MVKQHFHYLGNAAGAVKIRGDILSRRFQVAQYRHALPNMFKVLKLQRHARRMSDCQQVQHGISRTTNSHHDSDGVLESLASQDAARINSRAHRRGQHFAGPRRTESCLFILSRHG